MKVLHLANDFSGSSVYKEMCTAIDKLGVEQIIYNALRFSNKIGINAIEFDNNDSEIIFSKILNNYTRINFNYKKRKILHDIETKINNIESINIVHAHTWFSDGAVANELYKKYKIPYIVVIRNTDLNLFFKFMVHLRKLGIEILQNAKKIIFISVVYRKRFENHPYLRKFVSLLKDKSIFIPNGVNSYWIKNVEDRKINIGYPVQLLYIGNNSKNKNVDKLVQAVKLLNEEGGSYTLHLVGPISKSDIKTTPKESIQNYIYHGPIFEKDKLKAIIRNSDIFTMPSKSETFGLVYIEVLSQGIPIVHTKNEGIDGLYSNVGEAVNAKSVKDIANGIKKICNNYSKYDFIPKEILLNHDWNNIALEYDQIYQKLA